MDPFYRAFEERHRGSRELIKSRLEVYLPFVEPFKTLYKAPEILDLGCGRGEWLELLRNNGFQAKGVDIDEGMLSACRELDLNVRQADALGYLRGLTANKLSVVSAFHVVEHISFEALRQLIDEAYRLLKPGGLMILETPNTENLVVGTSGFYMDPTHQRPLPAQLLAFVVEYAGFARVKILYLQERPDIASTQQTTLANVLDGVSPDYAVIAQKKATKKVYALFDEPFERSYGLRLNTLADRYDQQTLSHTQWLQNEWDNAKPRIEELSKKTGQLEAALANEQAHGQWLQNEWDTAQQRIEELCKSTLQLESGLASEQAHGQWLQSEWDTAKQQIDELSKSKAQLEAELASEKTHGQWLQNEWDAANEHNTQLEARAQASESSAHHWQQQANEWHERILAIHKSTSWRITKPIRAVRRIFGGDFLPFGRPASAAILKVKQTFRPVLVSCVRNVLSRPKLRGALSSALKKLPWLHQRLLRVAVNEGVVAGAPLLRGIMQRPSEFSRVEARNAQQEIIKMTEISRFIAQPGINAEQKSPLESFFYQ
jgi:SAM-dependent methyltransferase